MTDEVVIYTIEEDPTCNALMTTLEARGVSFVTKDVNRDPQAMQTIAELGFFSVPVTVVNGTKIVGGSKPFEILKELNK